MRVAVESEEDIRELLLDREDKKEGEEGVGVEEPHVVVLSKLYETVAGNLHEVGEEIRKVFGKNALGMVVKELLEQCDVQAQKILARFVEEKRLDELIRATRSGSANPQDLGILLGELVLISQRTTAFFSFLKARCSVPKDVEDNDTTGKSTTAGIEEVDVAEVIATSKLSVWSDDLASKFVTLESYVIEKNCAKAISIDEWQSPTSLTSTAIDDTFFVLQKSIQRAEAYGGNLNVLSTLLRRANQCLTGHLLPHIRARLREAQSAALTTSSTVSTNLDPNKLLSSVTYFAEFAKANIPLPSDATLPSTTGTTQEHTPVVAKYDMYVSLNNASVSAQYASRFERSIEERLRSSGKDLQSQPGIRDNLTAIGDTAKTLKQVANGGLDRMITTLSTRIQDGFDRFAEKLSYVIEDNAYDVESGFSSFFTQNLEKQVLTEEIEVRVTEDLWDTMVRKIAERVADMLEGKVFLGRGAVRFNALGGLKAEREVRQLTGWFAEKCRKAVVRDLFTRLTQCAMIAALERLSEVHDVWDSGSGITWRLSAVEVKKVDSLRHEKPSLIACFFCSYFEIDK